MKDDFIIFGLYYILAFFITMLLFVINLCLNKINHILKKKSQLFKKLTKREYFAAMALQGFVAKYGVDCQEKHIKQAIFVADIFIEELNKTKQNEPNYSL